MKTSMSTKGQIVLPAELRAQDRLHPGQEFEIERVESGAYLLRKIDRPGQPGLVDLLLACPEKDWFQPLESESTDDVAQPFARSPRRGISR